MTVESIETAKNIVIEDPNGVVAVYSYTHAITNKTLYSIESHYTRGATESSGMCCNIRLIYTPENGWSI